MQRPVAIYGFTPGRTDVFWCSLDQSSIMQSWSDGGPWQTAVIAQSDGPFGLAPAIYSDQPGKMDIGWIDRSNKLWYMRWDGNKWPAPVELNPSAMTPVGGAAPVNFVPGSRLVACAEPKNRRSQNTEFLICDSAMRLWDLSFDGSTWSVADTHFSGVLYPPVQIKTWVKGIPSVPSLCLFWCDKNRMLLKISQNKMAGEAPSTFALEDFKWGIGTVRDAIRTGTDDLSAYLRSKNPPAADVGLNTPLLMFMNGLLTDPDLHPHYLGVAMRWETRELYDRHPQDGEDLRRLNRLMLEDAYPGLIVKTFEFFGPVGETEPAILDGQNLDMFWFVQPAGAPGLVLYNARFTNGKWSGGNIWPRPAVNYTLPLPFAPAVFAGPNGLDVIWRDQDGNVNDTFESPAGWVTQRVAAGSPLDSPPSAVYVATPNRVLAQVFWVGVDGNLRMASSQAAGWNAPQVIADSPRRPPPVPCWNFNQGDITPRMDVFYQDVDGVVKQRSGDGIRWSSETTVPGRMAVPPAPGPSLGRSFGQMFCADRNGALLRCLSDVARDGWDIRNCGSHSGSPLTWCDAVYFGARQVASGQLYWINAEHQLCVMDTGAGSAVSAINYDAAPGTNPAPPPAFSSRFAPTPLTFIPTSPLTPLTSALHLYLCDLDMTLWRVRQPAGVLQARFGSPQNLHLGPLAFAPVAAVTAIPDGVQRGEVVNRGDGTARSDVMLFWCAKEDMSLRQSWQDANGAWQTVTIDPGPMATGPALLNMPRGELYVLWGAQDGSLRNTWANARDIRDPREFHGWQTEVVSPGTMGSAPLAVWNDAVNVPFVFWRDHDGELRQSWLNWGYDPGSPVPHVPKWQTMIAAPGSPRIRYTAAPEPEIPVIWPTATDVCQLRPRGGTGRADTLRHSQSGMVDLCERDEPGRYWYLEPVSDGIYRIKSSAILADGKSYLSSPLVGNMVNVDTTEDASGRQKWKLNPRKDGSFTIEAMVPAGTGKYLSVNAGRAELSSEDDGSGRQRWQVMQPRGLPAPDCRYHVEALGGVQGPTTLNFNEQSRRVNLSGRQHMSERQDWYFDRVSTGIYRIRNSAGTGDNKYLSCPQDGTFIDLRSDDSSGRQRWRLTSADGASYTIESAGGVVGPRRYLSGVLDDSWVNLSPDDDGSGRQRWRLTQA